MPKINWKKIGKIGLEIGKQLFPVIGIVESFSQLKKLTGKEKQDAAFNALKDNLLSSLLPEQARKISNDPRFERKVRDIIDDGVSLNNLIAEILSEED